AVSWRWNILTVVMKCPAATQIIRPKVRSAVVPNKKTCIIFPALHFLSAWAVVMEIHLPAETEEINWAVQQYFNLNLFSNVCFSFWFLKGKTDVFFMLAITLFPYPFKCKAINFLLSS